MEIIDYSLRGPRNIENQHINKTCRKMSKPRPTAEKKVFLHCIVTEPRFYNTPINKWITLDVMSWIMSVSGNEHESYKTQNFRVNGEDLLKMSKQDFMKHDAVNGVKLYKNLQALKDEQNTTITPTVKRPRGRPVSQTRLKVQKIKRCRLWEFLIQLLANPEYNPSIIKWENQEEGLFRIKESEKVAQIWGGFRGKTGMDYIKMSRLMRYYYKNKELIPDKQRLVYRFGPNATGWHSAIMNSKLVMHSSSKALDLSCNSLNR